LNHRERAHEIDETRDTKVELPIHHREVETVDEENLYGNAGVGYHVFIRKSNEISRE
jgi:hypothetical protein